MSGRPKKRIKLAVTASTTRTQRRERQRCISIVHKYRDELMDAYRAKPGASNAMQVLRLIQRLDDMMREMAEIPSNKLDDPEAPGRHEVCAGGFSMEEIAKAEEIIRDQERNPFD